jgi:hypothetical protein
MRRNFRQNRSGQVIVVTALLVAIVLLSTAVYVVKTEKSVPSAATQTDVYPAYEESLRNTLISVLANITGGGNPAVLSTDLSKLQSAFSAHSYQAILQMDYSPLEVNPYLGGFWISSGTNGQGVSSVCVDFAFSSAGLSQTSSMAYNANITSQIAVAGSYQQVNDSQKEITLTISVLNEGSPALAQNFLLQYQVGTDWVAVGSTIINDHGDGTYSISFNAETGQIGDPVVVSVLCEDQRGIFVGASLTCNAQ